MLLKVVIFLWILIGTFCGVSLFYASSSTKRMKQVDSTGHYESDDETGFFFEQLKQIQLMLDDLFEPTEGDEDAEKKEK